MEGASIGFLIGAIVCLMAFLAGNMCADNGRPEEETERTDDPTQTSPEEMIAVLGYFQLGATSYERKVLGQIIDIISEREEEDG